MHFRPNITLSAGRFQFLRYNCSEKGSQRNLLYLVVGVKPIFILKSRHSILIISPCYVIVMAPEVKEMNTRHCANLLGSELTLPWPRASTSLICPTKNSCVTQLRAQRLHPFLAWLKCHILYQTRQPPMREFMREFSGCGQSLPQ